MATSEGMAFGMTRRSMAKCVQGKAQLHQLRYQLTVNRSSGMYSCFAFAASAYHDQRT